MSEQLGFFGTEAAWPEGFRYAPAVISEDEEKALLEMVRPLPFRDFEFQGYVGRRRVVSFGWRYDFDDRRLHRGSCWRCETPPRASRRWRRPARSEWEHSIPAVDRLRYSITYRNLRRRGEDPLQTPG